MKYYAFYSTFFILNFTKTRLLTINVRFHKVLLKFVFSFQKTPFIPRKPSIPNKMASSKARESDFSSKLEKENEKQSQAAETSKDADDPDKNTIDVGFF